MEDYDKRINNLEQWKASLENAIIQGRALGYAPPLLNPPEKEVAALLPVGNLPHFQLRRDDREVLAVLHGLKHLEWSLRKVKQEGVFVGEVSEEEWLAALKGPEYARVPLTRRIPWKAKYLVKSFVIQYLGSECELAEKVFCLAGGKEITGLRNTNISKNKEMCDEQTGKIAIVIRKAIRFAD